MSKVVKCIIAGVVVVALAVGAYFVFKPVTPPVTEAVPTVEETVEAAEETVNEVTDTEAQG